ncbi:hypothetical protein B0H66DRAFT_395086 [Apodospora peruviana]|uniref:DUF7708 domain-containing protein n=1 Tax=Apodospora peruviana TaxID=516989 RepID=A0AAE0HSL5_9PEZI|nr:hypothetical protein B0H66DRAFT_395086 [Apodospora peruviana]
MDVLSQHNPEYVSLAWGAMKFLFVAVINHQKLLDSLAKGLAQIAGALPRMELAAFLYPTEMMKQALAEIYASIIFFLIRAHGWFKESRFSRAVHSITRPTELRYDDLLQEIEASTRQFDSLAMAASHAEQRDIHLLLLDVKQKLIEQQQLNASYHLNTHTMLSDLQFSQILTHLSNIPLEAPDKTLQSALFHRNRYSRSRGPKNQMAEFWRTPRFRNWGAANSSSLIMIQGTFALRVEIKGFLVSMVECVQNADAPILWALNPTPQQKTTPNSKVSVIDILKYLTAQALQLRKSVPEGTARAACARFQTATTEAEWVELLASSLAGQRQVYIVVDVELLSTDMDGRPSLPSVFWLLFNRLQQAMEGGAAPVIKVALASYGSVMFHAVDDTQKRDFVLPIRGSPSVKRPAPMGQSWRQMRSPTIPIGGGRGRNG